MQLLKLGEARVSGVSPSNKHDINISTVYLTDLLLPQYCFAELHVHHLSVLLYPGKLCQMIKAIHFRLHPP